mmetsp:Transcript_35686/g.77074  ORF Transcript_35686/g.77074 Transcript_35686/m.77074 type:complete len:287 (-) Transcript_35686:152-1012(-)
MHGLLDFLVGAISQDALENGLRSLALGSEGGERVEHHGDAHVGELVQLPQRSGAEFSEIGQEGNPRNGLAELLVLLQVRDSLREDAVSTSLFHISLGSLDGRIEALDSKRIGSGHDDHLLASTRCCLQSGDHLLRRHHLLVGAMATSLRQDLILHVDGASTSLLHVPNGALDVEDGSTKACVDIHQGRHGGDSGQSSNIHEHILKPSDAQVGHAHVGQGDTATAHIDGLEAHVLGHATRICTGRTHNLKRLLRLVGLQHQLAELSSHGLRAGLKSTGGKHLGEFGW